jgi:starch synthase
MKVLFVTSEIHPLIKTGGLADVSRSLPLALLQQGIDVRILVPGYSALLEKVGPAVKTLVDLSPRAPQGNPARLLATQLPGTALPLLILDCPALYHRPGGPYQSPDGLDWPDNPLRFGFLCQMGAWLASAMSPLDWHPEIVQCNDWQSALIPAFLHRTRGPHARSLMTVHNLAFQGIADPLWITRLGLSMDDFHPDGFEFYGQLSFLKAGLFYANMITTVSKTYAREIQTAAFGCGLEGLLQARERDLIGITNGIDKDWDPANDLALPERYDAASLETKTSNKLALQRQLGLTVAARTPLLGLVSRLTHQKGIDLLMEVIPTLLEEVVQLAILGNGETKIEEALLQLARDHPGRVSVTIAFHEELAHRIIAGSDLFLMPSRFEPCGLAQMYAMAYGTPPVVRLTGGLADTVRDSNPHTLRAGSATGFVFEAAQSDALLDALQRALTSYRSDGQNWRLIQRNGMASDFGWQRAADEYRTVYQRLITG